MKIFENSQLLNQVPVLHVRGTHYQVGLSMGRTFKSLIQEFFTTWDYFVNVILPNCLTERGKVIFDEAYNLCEMKFPGYVDELRGVADGAEISFHKIFMLHIDSLTGAPPDDVVSSKIQADSGCTSVLCNTSETLLAQNEDGWPENLNRFYIIIAEIVDNDGNRIEKYGAMSYSGLLPGYSMGFNDKGVVTSVNTMVAKERYSMGTPRWFVTRAMLAADSHERLLEIVSDVGTGVADGFNVNVGYMNNDSAEVFGMYSIEVAPPRLSDRHLDNKMIQSQVSVKRVPPGESYVHCNKYLHLDVPELTECLSSSIRRHEAISKLPPPISMQSLKVVMSDQNDSEYPVYRRSQLGGKDGAKTVATGIFDIRNRIWYVYSAPAAHSEAIARISMNL